MERDLLYRAAQAFAEALHQRCPGSELELNQRKDVHPVNTLDQYVVDTIITMPDGKVYHYALMARPDGTVYNIPVVEV